MKRVFHGLIVAGVLTAAASGTHADERTYFSAYITQAYMRPIKNEPRGVDQKGTFDATSYSLNMRFAASDTLTLATELHSKSWAFTGGGSATSLDPQLQVAAGIWRFDQRLRLSAGIQRTPLGIYGEVRDLGVAVQSFMPILYQPVSGFAPETYRGVGLALNTESSALAVDAQLFFGEMQTPAYESDPIDLIKFLFLSGDYREIDSQRLRNSVGGRINLSLLRESILLSASGYSGHNYDGEKDDQESNAWILGGKLQNWGLQVRGEYAVWNRNAPILDGALTTWYFYGAWTSPWDLSFYVNYDRAEIDDQVLEGESIGDLAGDLGAEILETFDASTIPILLEIASGSVAIDQTQITIGIDWRPKPELSIKLEDYMMKGLLLVPDLDTYEEFSHTLVVSVSYTFQ